MKLGAAKLGRYEIRWKLAKAEWGQVQVSESASSTARGELTG